LPVVPVKKAVDPKKNTRKKWRAEEEERHKGLLTQKGVLGITFIPKHVCIRPKIRVARFFLVHDTKTAKNVPNEYKMYQMVIHIV
jgi:hypothetical protein